MNKKELFEKYDIFASVFTDSDDPKQLNLAALLENQVKYNRTIDDAEFKRISIPVLIKVWKSLVVKDLASINVMETLKETFSYTTPCGIKEDEVEASDMPLRAVWTQENFASGTFNLDAEAELAAILAMEIAMEIDRKFFQVIRNNAGTNTEFDFDNSLGDTIREKFESLYLKMIEVDDIVKSKIGSGTNWIATSPEIASIFETSSVFKGGIDYTDFTSSLGVCNLGRINNRWEIYKDPLFPVNTLIMGHKGNFDNDCGLFLNLHTLLKLDKNADKNAFFLTRKMCSSGAFRLTPNGEDHYGLINFKNFIT